MTVQDVPLLPGLNVSRETLDRLKAFEELVRKWTPKINLIGPGTLIDLWNRHILDSAQLLLFVPAGWQNWTDLGSGGGFPGIVISILTKDSDRSVTLVESDGRKAAFLRTCVRELSLSATVLADRIEVLRPSNADVVTARALAPLPALLPLVQQHLSADGTALLQKGRSVEAELRLARAHWTFDLQTHTSLTEPDARILSLTRIAHV